MDPAEKNAVAVYIRTHIFTMHMKSLWRETEPYVRIVINDIHINRLLRYRDGLVKKIKYMREKLGKIAFPQEAATMRAESSCPSCGR